jgi:hypothetical protein
MADIIYRGLSGVRVTLTGINTSDDLDTITNAAIADEGLASNFYADFFLLRDGSVTRTNNGSDTYADLGLTASDTLVAVLSDDPTTFTKQQRQTRKLDIATIKRAADTPARRDSYDINELPNPYNGNAVDPDDGASAPLTVGRPWS